MDATPTEVVELADAVELVETTIGGFVVGVPVEAGRVDAEPVEIDQGEPRFDERRWSTPDGLYLVVTALPARVVEGTTTLVLDEAVGATLARYVNDLGGVVEVERSLDVPGGVAGRVVRATFTSLAGEALGLLLVAALRPDHRVGLVQVTWSAPLADRFLPVAIAVGRSLTCVADPPP